MSNNKNSCAYSPRKVLTQKQAMKEKVGSFYHPTEKTYRTGACPPGYELKKGYIRKGFTKKDGHHVPKGYVDPVCIKNKGTPGKTLNSFKPFVVDKSHLLHPYNYSTKKSPQERFAILLTAAKDLTYKTVILYLNQFRTLTRLSNPNEYKILDVDIKALQSWRKKNPDLYKKKIMTGG